MTTATEDRIVHFVATARSHVSWRNVAIVLLSLALLVSYCSGRASKNRDLSDQQYAASQHVVHDTVKVVNDRLRVDTLRLVKTVRVASEARAAHDSAAARIVAIADETLIPTSLVLPEIKACDVALASADSVNAGYQKALADAVQRGDYAVNGLALAEKQLKKSRSRFGFRSGLLSGIALTAALVKVLR